ncbi:MAG: cupin domain-containing protein [Myxococcota bacterium]
MSDSHHSPALSALFGPIEASAFLDAHWDRAWRVFHGPVGRLSFLRDQPELLDLGKLCDAQTGPISGYWIDDGGALRELDVQPSQAKVLADAGFCLLMMELERWAGPVMGFVRQLARELGLPDGHVRTSAFVAPQGGVLRKHFDPLHVFSLQLVGTKTWELARNTEIPSPTEGHSPPGGLQPDLLPITTVKPPLEMPADTVRVEMKPGSVLFMPRGDWHATHADTDSISLSIGFEPPPWVDVVLDALRTELLSDAAWRESSWTGRGPGPRREAALARLASILPTLGNSAMRLDASALLDSLDRGRRGGGS